MVRVTIPWYSAGPMTHHYPTRSHHWQKPCDHFEISCLSQEENLSPYDDAVNQDDTAPVPTPHMVFLNTKMKFHIYHGLHNHSISILLNFCGQYWRQIFQHALQLHHH
ncbi:hypothetical protein AVEN_158717-1 [Araneus ventricosus]|uniref:Uncharacterized protein n=1 Tax=Araneus ventricosus TaxID=182803 RepID=A0A4Y2HVH9_ARAVE|nr:hypothetical protein AVEN_158717-1 [Araneus ventricosus]